MISQTRKFMIAFLTAIILLTTGSLLPISFLAIPIAQAGGQGKYWAHWKVELDFTNGNIDAIWTVFLGEYDSNGQMIIVKQQSEKVNCTPYGNFKVDNGEALFDGASHLACDIPSYYAAIQALLDGAPMPFPEPFNQHCECMNPIPWVAADLTLSSMNENNPILYHVDHALQFSVTRNGDLATSRLQLNNGEPLPKDATWTVAGDGNQLWSGSGVSNFLLMTDAGWFKFLGEKFYNLAASLTGKEYLLWANTAPDGVVFDHETSFTMTSQPTTFLVGYDLRSHFVGKIRKLSWDPSCTPPSGL